MVRAFSTSLFLIPLVACEGPNAEDVVVNVTDVVARGNVGVSGEFCADFSLTKDQAQYFFNNAAQVSARDIHDTYSFLPCFVKGVGYLKNNECEWEIRAGGTSRIECEDSLIFMACENCLPIPE